MKTFKLKKLRIKESVKNEIKYHDIELLDGLSINREDEKNRWIIEAYVKKEYMEFFERLRATREEIMLEVKITKESNPSATFITKLLEINVLGKNMNVLFIGTIVDQRKSQIEDLLKKLIAEGYQGEQLLQKFKQMI